MQSAPPGGTQKNGTLGVYDFGLSTKSRTHQLYTSPAQGNQLFRTAFYPMHPSKMADARGGRSVLSTRLLQGVTT